MSLHDRIESLKAKHADLESAIESQIRSTSPDTARINDLKRKKLRIKDELTRISTVPH
ncbi:YdcH family protein [Paramagnetospirillum marisnigri]|uniref:YdcH family protein n=1 Tax=Paramagnetospirillum marisnigri TaxID=1285242 RepID=UPI0009EEE828|nr:YdcH family protein [Paramagnetospirillum marisnigri]